MAIKEETGLLRAKDDDGTEHLLYPVTKVEAIEGLDEKLTSNVIDNLLSDSPTLPLSANQGRILGDKIDVSSKSAGIRNSSDSNIERSQLKGSIDETSGNPSLGFKHFSEKSTASNDEISFRFDGKNFYATGRLAGADTVTKKLGSVIVTKIGSFRPSSSSSQPTSYSFSAKSIDGYRDLTLSNFAFIPDSIYVEGGIQGTPKVNTIDRLGNISMSYNSTTGIVTISNIVVNPSQFIDDTWVLAWASVGGSVYCYHN